MNPYSQPSASAQATKPINTPPKAPLVLRVGVTGHRPEAADIPPDQRKRPDPDLESIHRSVREVLEIIRTSFVGVATVSDDHFDLLPADQSRHAGGTLRIISQIATGADTWVTQEALKMDYELQCILPFERSEYALDFTDPDALGTYNDLLARAGAAVMELDGRFTVISPVEHKHPGVSYEASGRALIHQTDLLIAIWDGNAEKGKGGTGQVVREALQNGIPVVWIPWSSHSGWTLQCPPWRLYEEPADLKGDSDRLAELIPDLLLPPEETSMPDLESGNSLRKAYFRESQKSGNPQLGMWALFQSIVTGSLFREGRLKKVGGNFRVKDFMALETGKADNFWTKKEKKVPGQPTIKVNMRNPVDPNTRKWINDRFLKHYAWANGLSIFYGDLHRSAYLLNYIFGALAVFLALICIAAGIEGKDQTGWIVAELIVIIGILSLTQRGRRKRWHQRWIDYRALAEHLRLSRCLILFGGGSPRITYEGHLSSYGNPARTWMRWHYRAIERAAGLPPVKFDATYLDSCQEFWRDGLVLGQINYHNDACNKYKLLDKRLHKLGDLMFIMTLVACAVHLLHLGLEHNPDFGWVPKGTGDWMVLLCAFLPALGAAFAAIRSHSEAQRLAQRSKAMEENLVRLRADLARVPVAADDLNSVLLREQADRVSDLMTNEFLDWRVVFQDRPLGLPT